MVLDAEGTRLEVLDAFALSSRLSRRDSGRARRIVGLQRRFTQPAGKRFKPLLFARSEEFGEALDLFRLRSMAWGQGWDVYEAWLERRRRALELPPEQLPARSGSRRRRRPRKRRKAASGPGAGADS